ncbi:MAG: hypothetical protein ABIO92_03700 [Chloroflexia bacterium]
MAVITPTQDQSVKRLLTRYAGRIRLERRRRYLSLSFLALGAAWLVSALFFYGDLLDPRVLPYALALPLLLPIGALVLERFRQPSTVETALAIDLRFDNQQRVLTAVELLDTKEPKSLDTEQLSSTTDLITPFDARVVYPVRSPLPAYSLSGGLLLLAVGIILFKGAPAGFVPIQALGLPGNEQALSALVSPTAASGLPDSNKPTETPQPDPSQTAVAAGSQGNDAPSPEQQAASEDAQSGLDRLQQGLNEQSATQSAADSLQQGDYGQAGDQLAELGQENDQLSEAAKQGLADSLDRAADESESTPDLQKAERSAAEALRKGNYKQIDEALKNLGEELKETAQNVIPQQELAQGFPEQSQESGQQGQEGQQQQGQQGKPSDQQSGQPQEQGEQGQGQQEGGQSQSGEQSDGSQGDPQGQQGEQGGEGAQGGQQGQQGGEGQQNQSPGGGKDGEGDGQPGAPGQGTRVDGPKDSADPNVEGNPFELENQPDQGKPSQDGERPALTLEGSAGASGASPVTPGGAVTAPGESNRLPVERWQIIQRYFGRER